MVNKRMASEVPTNELSTLVTCRLHSVKSAIAPKSLLRQKSTGEREKKSEAKSRILTKADQEKQELTTIVSTWFSKSYPHRVCIKEIITDKNGHPWPKTRNTKGTDNYKKQKSKKVSLDCNIYLI